MNNRFYCKTALCICMLQISHTSLFLKSSNTLSCSFSDLFSLSPLCCFSHRLHHGLKFKIDLSLKWLMFFYCDAAQEGQWTTPTLQKPHICLSIWFFFFFFFFFFCMNWIVFWFRTKNLLSVWENVKVSGRD